MFVWHHHSLLITQFFSHYLWAPYLSPVQLFHFFFQYPNSLNPVKKKRTDRTSEKKKRKKKEPNSQPRKRKKNRTANLEEKKKKQPTKKRKTKCQKVVKSCGRGSLCVFNYNIVIELRKLKTAKMCFQFP